jgi:ABC-type Na+ transport system ATPase subunit NatA
VVPDTLLVINRLAKAYRAGMPGCAATVEVLRGLSFTLRAGDFVTLEGPRGAGKTTLLLCASGMLRPDEGEVRWPALQSRPARPPAGIAYTAERAPMYGFLTVRESLAYAATVRELHEPGTARDAGELIDLVGLGPLADTRLGLLAAAERARMIVALALIASPRLELIDDVGSGDGPVERAAFAQCLARLAATGAGVAWAARAIGTVAAASAAYTFESGRLRALPRVRAARRVAACLELDVLSAGDAAALLAPRLTALERRGDFVRVPLDGKSAEEVLALCRDLSIAVRASRVVRETP